MDWLGISCPPGLSRVPSQVSLSQGSLPSSRSEDKSLLEALVLNLKRDLAAQQCEHAEELLGLRLALAELAAEVAELREKVQTLAPAEA